jgi:ornithine cyclodeaminase/alanine dehydrogenase-like protein (mu-crystallin family)
MALLLTESVLKEHVSIEEVFPALEKGYKDLALGGYNIPPRTLVSADAHKGRFVYMQAYLPQLGVIGSKSFSIYLNNPKRGLPTNYYYYLLNDANTGELLAIANGTHLTDLRTAATPIVASKYMAMSRVTKAAVFGAGHVAEYQVWGLGVAYPDLEALYIHDINIDKAKQVRDKWEKKVKPKIIIAESPKTAVAECQIINTATSSSVPVFDAKDVKPGTHINAIGAVTPTSREIPGDVVVNAKIVTQSKKQLQEAGDILIPIKEGRITEDAVYAELHEIVSGEKPGRENPEEITLFESIGYGIEDVVTMKLAYDIAKKKGFGDQLKIN